MAFRELITFLSAHANNDNLLRVSSELAREQQARLVAVFVASGGFPSENPNAYARGEAVDAVIAEYLADETQARDIAQHRFAQLTRLSGMDGEWRDIGGFATATEVIAHARYADLSIVMLPEHLRRSLWGPEDILFAFGGPTLLVPRKPMTAGSVGKRILVAWNGSRESRRALNDSLPLLAQADSVTILMVDPEMVIAPHAGEPGVAIAGYLGRHGISPDIKQTTSASKDVGDLILDCAADINADFIVMGAYGHSRVFELVLGGATRTVLGQSPLPVLMSH